MGESRFEETPLSAGRGLLQEMLSTVELYGQLGVARLPLSVVIRWIGRLRQILRMLEQRP